MKLTVQVIIESDDGNTTVQKIACMERGTQRLAQLGLTLNEGKALLKDVQQAMVREQVNQYMGAHTLRLPDGVWHAAVTQSTSVRMRLPNAGHEEHEPAGRGAHRENGPGIPVSREPVCGRDELRGVSGSVGGGAAAQRHDQCGRGSSQDPGDG